MLAGDPELNCTPGPALPGLLAQYVTPGPGQLACTQGTDVTYPPAAPGFAYDPTGSSNASVRTCALVARDCAPLPAAWRRGVLDYMQIAPTVAASYECIFMPFARTGAIAWTALQTNQTSDHRICIAAERKLGFGCDGMIQTGF